MINLPVTLFSVAMVGAAASILSTFVGAALYDLRMIKLFRPYKAHPHAAPYRKRPLVSLVFITRNNEKTIQQSLHSAFLGSYRKLEVIVLDNASADGTVAAVRDYMARNPKRIVKMTRKRTKAAEKALLQSLRRVVQGELTMIAQPGIILDKDAVKKAVEYFLVNDTAEALVGRRAVLPEQSVINIAQQLRNIVVARVQKARAGFGFMPSRSMLAMYTKAAFKTQPTPTYVHEVVALSQRSARAVYPYARYRVAVWLMWAMFALGVAYIWYIALRLHVVEPLGVLWLTVTLGGLVFTLSDEYLSFGEKVRTLSVIPLWYIFCCLFLVFKVLSPLEILKRIRIHVSLLAAED